MEVLPALKRRISERRNNDIISVMKFLQNPESLKEKSCDFFKMESKRKIIKLIKTYASYFSSTDSSSTRSDNSDSDIELTDETTGIDTVTSDDLSNFL